MKFFVAIELFISVGATFGTRTLSDGSESADFDRSGVFGGVGARPVFGSLVYPGPTPFARRSTSMILLTLLPVFLFALDPLTRRRPCGRINIT